MVGNIHKKVFRDSSNDAHKDSHHSQHNDSAEAVINEELVSKVIVVQAPNVSNVASDHRECIIEDEIRRH